MDKSTRIPYKIPTRVRIFRSLLCPVFRGIFHLLAHVRIFGRENVPSKGPYLITINHVSLFDPPFVIAFWPVAPEAVGAVDIWSRRGQSTLARLYGGIQAHRGEYDRKLLDSMQAALQCGYPLLIAPEGRRSHTPGMQRARQGTAYIVDKTGVPVVPVGIVGTTGDFIQRALHGRRPTIEMHIGEAFQLPPVDGKGENRRTALLCNIDQIMYQIADQLPPEYRGVYSLPHVPSKTPL